MMHNSGALVKRKTIVAISALSLPRLPTCLAMADFDHEMPDPNEDQQLLETFKQMNKYLPNLLAQSGDDEQHHKKAKRAQPASSTMMPPDRKLVPLLAQLVVRLDMENQTLRRQDSFIFYMQTQKDAILPTLLTTAKDWHNNLTNRSEEVKSKSQYLPLRLALAQTMVHHLDCRLQKIAQSPATDPLWTTAIKHGMLTEQGLWPYRRWNPTTQNLETTTQAPVSMDRMLKYIEQLKSLVTTPGAIMKFHSLRPQGQGSTIPWLLQTGVRQDELQVLMEVLTGNNIWGLLGTSVKPHTLAMSPQAQKIQELLGKGNKGAKGKSKGVKP